MAKIQIEKSTFFKIFDIICLHSENEQEWQEVEKELNERFEQLMKRDLYSAYRTAKTPEEREKARQEYLDRVGIPIDYRW